MTYGGCSPALTAAPVARMANRGNDPPIAFKADPTANHNHPPLDPSMPTPVINLCRGLTRPMVRPSIAERRIGECAVRMMANLVKSGCWARLRREVCSVASSSTVASTVSVYKPSSTFSFASSCSLSSKPDCTMNGFKNFLQRWSAPRICIVMNGRDILPEKFCDQKVG